jgi:hypothetical protein
MLFLAAVFGIMVLIAAKRNDNEVKPLSWPLAVCLASCCAIAMAASGVLANVIAQRLFLFVYSPVGVSVRITWWSRSEIVLSNGDRFGQGASQVLQFIDVGLWVALLIGSFFIIRGGIRIVAPRAYDEYARILREWSPPSSGTGR